MRARAALPLVLGLALSVAAPAEAYVGPGAGFALISSFFVLLSTILLAVVVLASWPFRVLWRLVTRRRRPKAHVRRLVIVGFDGQDPVLTGRLMAEGRLPNLAKLASIGTWSPLGSTCPPVSPVAWSSFSTGTNPARHNVFDFITRDPRTYLPVLSSVHVGKAARVLRLGRFCLPLQRPELRLLRRSRSFWSLLGDHGVWSTILRVPISFPPERFHGAQLAAMCVPDLLGTQGTFTCYTTRVSTAPGADEGRRVVVRRDGDSIRTTIAGPPNPFIDAAPPLTVPLEVRFDQPEGKVKVRVGRVPVDLEPGAPSEWITLSFRAAPGVAVRGLCRFLVTERDPEFSLYMSPICLDPEKPAMPISHPSYYATYLAARIGPYSTLGIAEDTAALNAGVIDEEAFLRFTHDIDAERQAMFLSALDRLREGLLVCVFDATDRIQHMCWRDLERAQPATRPEAPPARPNAIEDVYERNDALVGQVLDRLGPDAVLMVLSDHGFTAFRRGVNLNGWLREQGYLVLADGADGTADWLRHVDWSRTRAYALGLTSLFLNVEGRESAGIVPPGEPAAALRRELAARLTGLVDDETGDVAIREAFDASSVYSGPYLEHAPDLIVGCNHGYRVSWGSASGRVAGPVFEDNTRQWSGDHSVDARLVPGVFFCNRRIDVADPSLLDVAPTALALFGITPPPHMEGRPLFAPATETGP
jgi:predicted AlkP superfamily phosphohydrolase/phosphomutase